jgi:putative PIN family toxin of toxin-antitoxin system
MPERVVFDCSLFLQAATSERGPSFKCFQLVEQGHWTLLLSPRILAEIRDVLSRPILKARIPVLTDERVESFLRKFTTVAVVVPNPPSAFVLPRDRDDEPYTDLAIAAKARYLVTWNDRHLTYLMRQDTPEGKEFCQKFPTLSIVSPPIFIQQSV